jgi:hypothetical protein
MFCIRDPESWVAPSCPGGQSRHANPIRVRTGGAAGGASGPRRFRLSFQENTMNKSSILFGAVTAIAVAAAFVLPQTLTASAATPAALFEASMASHAPAALAGTAGTAGDFYAEKLRAVEHELPAQF